MVLHIEVAHRKFNA